MEAAAIIFLSSNDISSAAAAANRDTQIAKRKVGLLSLIYYFFVVSIE